MILSVKSGHWWMVIVCLWAVVISYPNIDRVLPSSNWMEIRVLHVDDSKLGVSPRIRVDRVISKDFTATWSASLQYRAFETFYPMGASCNASNVSNYTIGSRYPKDIDLFWWLEGAACDLPPGEYRLLTTWTITTDKGIIKVVKAFSNVFSVTE